MILTARGEGVDDSVRHASQAVPTSNRIVGATTSGGDKESFFQDPPSQATASHDFGGSGPVEGDGECALEYVLINAENSGVGGDIEAPLQVGPHVNAEMVIVVILKLRRDPLLQLRAIRAFAVMVHFGRRLPK